MPRACDNQVFIIPIRKGRIGLRVAAINCNEKRLTLIPLVPYMAILPRVIVLVVRAPGSKIFVPVKRIQVTFHELVNDTPNVFRLITQNVGDSTTSSERPAGKSE